MLLKLFIPFIYIFGFYEILFYVLQEKDDWVWYNKIEVALSWELCDGAVIRNNQELWLVEFFAARVMIDKAENMLNQQTSVGVVWLLFEWMMHRYVNLEMLENFNGCIFICKLCKARITLDNRYVDCWYGTLFSFCLDRK